MKAEAYIELGFRIGFLLFLLSASWQDLRKKTIRASTFYIWGMLGVLLRSIQALYRLQQNTYGGMKAQLWAVLMVMLVLGIEMILVILPGLVLLGICAVTEEAMGKGDGWFFRVTGVFLGFWKTMLLLAGGLFLCFPVAAFLMISKWRKDTTKRLPLLPFMFPVGLGVLFL